MGKKEALKKSRCWSPLSHLRAPPLRPSPSQISSSIPMICQWPVLEIASKYVQSFFRFPIFDLFNLAPICAFQWISWHAVQMISLILDNILSQFPPSELLLQSWDVFAFTCRSYRCRYNSEAHCITLYQYDTSHGSLVQ